MKILAFDPSGNFKEGKGTTGICQMVDGQPIKLDEIKARDYSSPEEYWAAHVEYIRKFHPKMMVIEGYRLYNHRGQAASSQANSELETVQLIGIIKYVCSIYKIPLGVQFASEVKSRWKEDVLVHMGMLDKKTGNRYYFRDEATNDHKRDALKHAMHFYRYKAKGMLV